MALNDISLTSSMRSNLIALQNTATLLSRTQDRLSTGKKVNTALDNPTNFFAAQANTQRANDLSTRKDAMTEAVQGVDAANKGITAITSLIEAAKGLTQAARSADTTNRRSLATQFNEVRNQISQMASDSSYKGKNFLTGDTLNVLFNENGSSALAITGFDATASGLSISGLTIGSAAVATAGASGLAGLSGVVGTGALVAGTASGTASLAAGSGTLEVGGNFWAATSGSDSGVAVGTSGTVDVMSALSGFSTAYYGASLLTGGGNMGNVQLTGIFVSGQRVTATGAASIHTTGSYASGNLSIVYVQGATTGGAGVTIATGTSISFAFSVDTFYSGGASALKFYVSGGGVNTGIVNSMVNVKVSGVDIGTGNFSLSGDASGAYILFTGLAVPPNDVSFTYSNSTTGSEFNTQALSTASFTLSSAYQTGSMDVYIGGTLRQSGVDYSGVGTNLTIINSGLLTTGSAIITTENRIFDTGVTGAGLVLDSLTIGGVTGTTGFSLVTSGTDNFIVFASGYGPQNGDAIVFDYTKASVAGSWDSDNGIDASVSGLNTAIETLRTKSANLASNLSVVTIREDFTDGLVNTLLKGADNLTLADMNQEGANMLMLQTRQQLGTTSLKMASDAAQSVLRLF